MKQLLLVGVLVLAACSSSGEMKGADGGKTGAGGTKASGASAKATTGSDPCDPKTLGLGAAKPVTWYRLPEHCGGGENASEATIENEDAFGKAFACSPGVTSGIDFAENELVVKREQLSPAGAGTDIVDDGTKLTFIHRMRSPCPGDPHPMPMEYTIMYLLPAKAVRSVGETTCNVAHDCN